MASTKLATASSLDPRIEMLFEKLDRGIRHFNENQNEAVSYISTELGYTEPDAREWLKTVKFAAKTKGVKIEVVADCIGVLRKAGVLVKGKGMDAESMVVKT